MKLSSRDSIAVEIQAKIFNKHNVWSLIFKPTEALKFITGDTFSTDKDLYSNMTRNVIEKIRPFGATLKETFVLIGEEKVKITHENAEAYMTKIMKEDLTIVFRIMINNKNYEYQVNS